MNIRLNTLLIPCRTHEEVEEFCDLFKGTIVYHRRGEEFHVIEKVVNNSYKVMAYLHNESAICGLRAQAVLLRAGLGVSWEELACLISVPIDIKERIKQYKKQLYFDFYEHTGI